MKCGKTGNIINDGPVTQLTVIYRASNEEIAADYATAWLGYLIQENGTASEDCITIGCISLEVTSLIGY